MDVWKKQLKLWKLEFPYKKQLELLNLDAEDRYIIKLIEECMLENFKDNWKDKVTSDQGTRSSQSNKLRTYRMFKLEYGTEYYAVWNRILRLGSCNC